MQNTLLTLALSMMVLAPLGCVGGTTSCDFREETNSPEPRCQERGGIQSTPAFKTTCDSLGAKGIDGPCPEEGIVLGCDISPGTGGTVIDWYYEPKTEDEIEQDCADEGGTIVNP